MLLLALISIKGEISVFFKATPTKLCISLLCGTLFSTLACADELLKLNTLNINETPAYGDNIIIIQDDEYGLKGIQGEPNINGKIELPILLSSGDFELTLETTFHDVSKKLSFFFTQDELNLAFTINGAGSLILENSSTALSNAWQIQEKNTVKLTVKEDIARLYVNEVFLKKVSLENNKQGAKYNKLIVTHIEDGSLLYSMNLTNGTADSILGPAAKLSRNLATLHIPKINYNASEGQKTLWADFKSYPNAEGKILFEAVNYGAFPKKR